MIQPLSNQSADRQAAHGCAGDAKVINQASKVADMVINGIGRGAKA